MGAPIQIMEFGSTYVTQPKFEAFIKELSRGTFGYTSYHLLDNNW